MAKGVKNKASKPANNKAMRRISTKLISGIIPVVAIALVVLLAGIAITGRGVINELLTASMQKEAEADAKVIENELTETFGYLDGIADSLENIRFANNMAITNYLKVTLGHNDMIPTGVYIGVSDPRTELVAIPDAFAEARAAINVGRIYHGNKRVFLYRNLLLERFLSDVSPELGASYNARIFNRKTARLFNDEMIHTIETFFDNSLNLSETARKLYIHRNTLVYRLEKVQHAIGLDLRNFDDAVTFKMMMLLGKSENSRRLRL